MPDTDISSYLGYWSISDNTALRRHPPSSSRTIPDTHTPPAYPSTTMMTPTTAQTQSSNDALKGNPPQIFMGDRTKSNSFFLAFRLFRAANRSNSQMSVPYSRVTTALTYMEGDAIEGWKEDRLTKLDDAVTAGTSEASKTLWDDFEKSFKGAFTNTNKKMDAYQVLKGLKHGDNLDI